MGIQAALRQQLLMRAALDYPPMIEYQNQISRQNRAQAMGDYDAGSPGYHSLERILNQTLRFTIEMTRRFILSRHFLISDRDSGVCSSSGAVWRPPGER